ncbi:MAG: hypothetical protein ACE5SW_07135 [Nitrososphaeraceae archaeon]
MIAVGMNVIIGIDVPEIFKYKVDKNAPSPTGEPVQTIDEEPYLTYYHGPTDDKEDKR